MTTTSGPSAGTSSTTGLLSLRMLTSLPTPLALGLRAATSRVGRAPERISRRLAFTELVLQFIVGLQDTERAVLGLPRPKEVDALIARLERPTLGQWGHAAAALARQLETAPVRALPAVSAGLTGPGAGLYDGLAALISARNSVAHGHELGALSQAAAEALLHDSAGWLRAVVLGLEPLCGLRLVVAVDHRDGFLGTGRTQALLMAGEVPELRELELERGGMPLDQPVLVGAGGRLLRPFPWMATAGGSHDKAVLVLHRWADQPLFHSGGRGSVVPLGRTDQAGAELGTGPGGAFRSLPVVGAVSIDEAAFEQPAAQPDPETIGRFVVVELLGRGGTGSVWRVSDPEGGGDEFALKVLHPVLAGRADHVRRLRREHEVLAMLPLPGVVQMVEAVDTADHGPGILMELVDGPSLRDVARRGRVAPEVAAAWVAQVLDVLAVAHGRGIIHRDIKPSNVLLDGDEPRLIDFGVAWQDDGQRLTMTADVVGTRAYAAPEQLRGERCSPAVDIYACGRLLEELLTGGRSVEGRLPGPLGPVVRTATRASPEDRYASAAEMAAVLRQGAGDWTAALDPWERLPSQVEVRKVLCEVVPGLCVLHGVDASQAPAAVLCPAQGAAALQLFEERVGSVDLGAPHLAGAVRGRVVHTADGVPYVELNPRASLRSASLLLGLVEPEDPGAARPPQSEVPPPGAAPPGPDAAASGPNTGDTVTLGMGEAVALGVGAVAVGSLLGHVVTAGAKKREARRKAEQDGGPAQARQADALVGLTELLGALWTAGMSRVHKPARTVFERCHHLGLALLVMEASTGRFTLTRPVWRQAWTRWQGGLRILSRLERDGTELIQPLVLASRRWPAVAADLDALAACTSIPPAADTRVQRLARLLLEVQVGIGALPSERFGELPEYMRIKNGELQLRREPRSTGWQRLGALEGTRRSSA
jgi:predicted Ser/Thr protein kinase